MDNEYKYFQFPLMLLQKVHTDHAEAFQDIVAYAIVHFAKKQKVTNDDAARQALYVYYRGGGLIDLENQVSCYIRNGKITEDEDYNGFSGSTFYPEDYPDDALDEVRELFNKDKEFKELATLNCQLSKIDDFFKIGGRTAGHRLDEYNKIKQKVEKHESKFGKEPHPTIRTDIMFDFMDTPQPYVFCLYIAFRSLEGQATYTQTTKRVVLMRMLGAKSDKALNEALEHPELKAIYDVYNRTPKSLAYHFKNDIERLLNRGLLKSKIFERSVSRKIFVSTKLDYDELKKEMIRFANKRNNQKKELKARDEIKKAIQ